MEGRGDITRRQFLSCGASAVALAGILKSADSRAGIIPAGCSRSDAGKTNKGPGADMVKPSKIGEDFKRRLAMGYSPVGLYFTEKKPDDANRLKRPWKACIMPLVFSSARGMTRVLGKETLDRDCAEFFLGYKDWIFPGVQYFLSHAPLAGRLCEGFVKTPKLAKQYLETIRFVERSKGYAVFKPLERFVDDERPEVVIFFANPDQLSALVYLSYYAAPLDRDRVVAGFASGCGAVVTLPLQYARKGVSRAVWGLHDISARAALPQDLMTFTLPYGFLIELWKDAEESFMGRESWNNVRKRIAERRDRGE